MLADVTGTVAAPTGVEWPVVVLSTVDYAPAGLWRQVEAEQVVVTLRDLLRDCPIPKLLGQPIDLIIEHVREALEEEERQ